MTTKVSIDTLLDRIGNEDVVHFGVKGMRWGVRRSQATLDRASGRSDPPTGKDGKPEPRTNSRGLAGRNGAELTDAELKRVVNRMQMERQLQSLQPTPLHRRAAQAVGKAVAGAAQQQLNNFVSAQVGTTTTRAGQLLREFQQPARQARETARANVTAPPLSRTLTPAPRAEDRVG